MDAWEPDVRFLWGSEIHVDPEPNRREALAGKEPDRHFGAVGKRPRNPVTVTYAQRSQSRRCGPLHATVEFCEGPLTVVVDQTDPLRKVPERLIEERGECPRPDRIRPGSAALDETGRLVHLDFGIDPDVFPSVCLRGVFKTL